MRLVRSSCGHISNQGRINNYQFKRRNGNFSRNFDTEKNDNNKRTAKNTEEVTKSSDNAVDLNKRNKVSVSFLNTEQPVKENTKGKGNNEMEEIRKDLAGNWSKIG